MTQSCPECGGKTRKAVGGRIVCESCGLALTREELEETRQKLRRQMAYYDDDKRQENKTTKKKRRNREWSEWWSSEHEDE
ncbi:MAG: hypothetical protein ACTSUE_06620 [Promethearchaeota archaeon]